MKWLILVLVIGSLILFTLGISLIILMSIAEDVEICNNNHLDFVSGGCVNKQGEFFKISIDNKVIKQGNENIKNS